MTTDERKRAKELCDPKACRWDSQDLERVRILMPKLVEEVERLQGIVDGYRETYKV